MILPAALCTRAAIWVATCAAVLCATHVLAQEPVVRIIVIDGVKAQQVRAEVFLISPDNKEEFFGVTKDDGVLQRPRASCKAQYRVVVRPDDAAYYHSAGHACPEEDPFLLYVKVQRRDRQIYNPSVRGTITEPKTSERETAGARRIPAYELLKNPAGRRPNIQG